MGYYFKSYVKMPEADARQTALADAMKNMRLRKNIQQKQLADSINKEVSHSTLSRVEMHRIGLPDKVWQVVAKALGCTMEQLEIEAGLRKEEPQKRIIFNGGHTPEGAWQQMLLKLGGVAGDGVLINTLTKQGRFGRYEDGCFYWYCTKGDAEMVCRTINHMKTNSRLRMLLGSIIKDKVTVEAIADPTATKVEKPVPVVAKPTPAPVVKSPIDDGLTAEEKLYISDAMLAKLTSAIKDCRMIDVAEYTMVMHIIKLMGGDK